MNSEAPSEYEFRRALTTIQPGEHLGLLYSSREEQMAALIPILQTGLERGERCIYVADEKSVAELTGALGKERRTLEAAVESGQLLVLTEEVTFLLGGCFDADRVLQFCRDAHAQALADGFSGVRFFAEMAWTLACAIGRERIVEYEGRLNALIEELQTIVVCQYDRTLFPPEAILTVLRTHPSIIYGRVVGHNPYYVPAAEARAPRAELEVERLLSNLREREHAQSSFRQRFIAFLDHLPAFAWIKDLDGRYLYVNARMRALPAFAGAWQGKQDAKIWPAKFAVQFRANDARVIAEGTASQTVESFEVEGEVRYTLSTKFPIYDAHGHMILVGGASVEFTDRVRAEQALRASEERFRQLAENIQDIFWVQDAETRQIEYVSPAYEHIWHRTIEELAQNPQAWMESLHPEDRARIVAELELPSEQRAHDHLYRILWPDGTVRWIRDRAFLVRNEQGKVTRVVGLTGDVTETKLIETELRQANERLQTLTRRLYEVQERERRHLARELHDEIGQALTAAKISLKNAVASCDPKAAAILADTAGILDGLLGQVRSMSLDLRPSLLDDLGLVPALRSLLDQQTRRGGLAPHFSALGVPEVLDAEIQTVCFRIAQEALTNTLRHANARAVSIELRVDGDELQLTITDNGTGFAMRPFEDNLQTARSFGLLSIKERAELAGGKALILSTPGTGTMIDVRLPLDQSRRREETA
ncbi:MAG TPA: MEDS domain-containing protein [Chthoniobacteraceae bacterium]|jgi:PAS domain S-box-containing protein|nr:MEDS domain-containing protein [Chthoniobacteraceae bacterium]